MKVLIDMNLSPAWTEFLTESGHPARHWSTVGAPDAPDTELMAWAERNDHIVLSCDLDFGAILAASKVAKPSVLQIRSESLAIDRIGRTVIAALDQCSNALGSGALLTLDTDKKRIRMLPLTLNRGFDNG